MLKILKHNLARARNRMVEQANRKRKDKEFKEGDWVYLKLQPYRQISLKNRVSPKLSKRFYGPFRVLRRIGTVAYELDLPTSARIHPVFHISLLKECHGRPAEQICPLPLTVSDSVNPPLPRQILARRRSWTRKGPEEEVLVLWEGQNEEEATWELASSLVAAYPSFDLEDKIDLERGSNVRNSTEVGSDTAKEIRNSTEVGSDTAKEIQQSQSEIGPVEGVSRPKRCIKKPSRYST